MAHKQIYTEFYLVQQVKCFMKMVMLSIRLIQKFQNQNQQLQLAEQTLSNQELALDQEMLYGMLMEMEKKNVIEM